MLLLAHRDRETIVLETSDGSIEIRLSGLETGQPRIGIEAPGSVRIIRRPQSDQADPLSTSADERRVEGAVADDEVPWWLHPDDLEVTSTENIRRGAAPAGDWDDDVLL